MGMPQARPVSLDRPDSPWRSGCLAQLAHAELLLAAAEALRPPADARRRPIGLALLPIQAADLGKACGLNTHDTAVLAEVLALLGRPAADGGGAGDHARLFGADGACPAHEGAYRPHDRDARLADLFRMYRAFGFVPAPDDATRIDHITVELQFMARLLVLAAEAASAERDAARRAVAVFARDHLGAWLPDFTAHLRATAGGGMLSRTADLLDAVWTSLGRHGRDDRRTVRGT